MKNRFVPTNTKKFEYVDEIEIFLEKKTIYQIDTEGTAYGKYE